MRKILSVGLLVLAVGCGGQQSQYPAPIDSNSCEGSVAIPPITPEVKEAHKSTIAVTSRIIGLKDSMGNTLAQPRVLEGGGTAFMTKPGIFVSARHILMADIGDLT